MYILLFLLWIVFNANLTVEIAVFGVFASFLNIIQNGTF